MAQEDSRSKTIHELAQQLRRMERSRGAFRVGQEPFNAEARQESAAAQMRGAAEEGENAGPALSTGNEALDRLLPERGFHRGVLVEWLVEREGSGAGILALQVAAQRMGRHGILVIIDQRREFYGPAAAGVGIDLERTIVIRPGEDRDALWALEQSLCCRGVSVTLGWVERLDNRMYRRLQLAAERGGGLGLLMRSARARQQPSWADVRLLVRPLSALPQPATSRLAHTDFPSGRRVRIELLYHRGGMSGGAVELEISDETGDVHLVPELAPATNSPRAAGT